MEARPVAQHAAPSKDNTPKTSLFDVLKVLLRLGPKQINDEIQLAIGQMKTKGIAAGIAAALMVVGLVFVAFLVVALIVAAVAAFALIFELWAAALIVAGIFLVIALIFALVGYLRLKKALPFVPEDALRGLRLDLGVAKQGSSFDPQELDRQDAQKRRQKEEAKRAKAEEKKQPGGGEPTPPTYRELLRRTAVRRDHIGSLQDQVRARSNKESLKQEMRDAVSGLTGKVRSASKEGTSAQRVSKPGAPTASSSAAPTGSAAPTADDSQVGEFVSARWKPLAVLGASTAAGAVFLRELTKK